MSIRRSRRRSRPTAAPDRSSKFPNERDFDGGRPSGIGFDAKDHMSVVSRLLTAFAAATLVVSLSNGASAKTRQKRPKPPPAAETAQPLPAVPSRQFFP